MKIIIHSLAELLELTALIRGGSSTTKVGEIEHTIKVDTSGFDPAKLAQEICGTMTVSPEVARAAGLAAARHTGVVTTDEPDGYETLDPACKTGEQAATSDALDSAGYRWDDRIHSTPPKRNANGTWRARRGVDKDLVAQVEAEQLKAENDAADDAEPVATETHALPQDERSEMEKWVESEDDAEDAPATTAGATVNHAALIEASREAAKDAPDGTLDLLNAGKVFISEYGTAKFEALKAAVSPLEDGKGKPVPSLTPDERRLMRACMDNYALYL